MARSDLRTILMAHIAELESSYEAAKNQADHLQAVIDNTPGAISYKPGNNEPPFPSPPPEVA